MPNLPGTMMALVLAAVLAAAPARADDDAQVWTSLSASGQIRGNLAGYMDVNARFMDNPTHPGHFQVRGGLGWRVKPGVILGGGYSYVRTQSLSGVVAHEHRIFEQATYPILSWNGNMLTGRTRLEQRQFNGVEGTLHRLRQQIRLNIPLQGPKGLRAIMHTEALFLLNQTDGGAPAGLNQLRSFAGLGIPLAGKTALEAGYLNQSVFPGEDRHNHALSLGIVTSF